MKRVALDLFCGAGGAGMGMWRSGLFDIIIGVDIEEQPHYPFNFIKGDVFDFDIYAANADFVWASPPCQAYAAITSFGSKGDRESHPKLIDATRSLLSPFDWTTIENVVGAPVRPDIVLEGGNVGIPHMKRRRLFEVSWTTLSPKPYTDGHVLYQCYGANGIGRWPHTRERRLSAGMGTSTNVDEIKELWDIDWSVDWRDLTQMVPPAYSEYVVRDAMRAGLTLKAQQLT